MRVSVLLTAFVLAACGNKTASDTSTVRASSAQETRRDACQIFASSSLDAKKSVQPLSESVTKTELGMIQMAVLLSNGEAVSPQEALDTFTDRAHGGSLGGDIRYFEVDVNGRTETIAQVTYYPGDNEYGAIFNVTKWEDGSASASMIGRIGDSDVYCFRYEEINE